MISCEVTAWWGSFVKARTLYPNPFSLVLRAQMFSAVFGILSVNNLKETKPKGSPLTVVSKNTVGRRVSLGCSKLQLGTAAPTKSASAIRKGHSSHLNSDCRSVNSSLFCKWHQAFDKRNLLPFSSHRRGPHPETQPSRQVFL